MVEAEQEGGGEVLVEQAHEVAGEVVAEVEVAQLIDVLVGQHEEGRQQRT